MIRFIRDYTTQAIPPEVFTKDQEVTRSAESERYLVQLGVAGYLVDGKLVDQDYKPLVVTDQPAVIVAVDHRFGGGVRGGEVLGVDAPQRASTGPGNAVAFGLDTTAPAPGTPDVVLSADVERLTGELDAARQSSTEASDAAKVQYEALQGDHDRVVGELDQAKSALADAEKARSQAEQDRDAARTEATAAQADLAQAEQDRDAARAEATELRAQLEQATKPAAESASDPAADTAESDAGSGKPAKAKV